MSFLSRYVNKQLSAYQNELIQTHYEEVENMYRQVRGWRHDYRNHIQVMKSYAAAGDLEAVKGYLKLNCRSKFQCRSKFYRLLEFAVFLNFLGA